jgi:hypothetical protein
MDARETHSLWFWLKHHRKVPIRIIRGEYFWHDSFGKYWNRFLGCRLRGHKLRQWIDVDNGKKQLYCFACGKYLSVRIPHDRVYIF